MRFFLRRAHLQEADPDEERRHQNVRSFARPCLSPALDHLCHELLYLSASLSQAYRDHDKLLPALVPCLQVSIRFDLAVHPHICTDDEIQNKLRSQLKALTRTASTSKGSRSAPTSENWI